MKHDHGHKPMAKMSHGGHYCWGGKVMKKAVGGAANMTQGQMQSAAQQQAGKPAGLAALSPIQMQSAAKQIQRAPNPAQSRFAQNAYNQMQAQQNRQLPSKPQMAVMKKREGGDVKVEKAEKMPSGAQQYVRGEDRDAKHKTIKKYFDSAFDETEKSIGKEDFPNKIKKANKFLDASSDNTKKYSDEVDQRIYAEDFGEEGQAGMKRGGMAKGGNWIKGAIKKPGALHKQLGVPMGEKIPAGKLEKASKAPGKLGQRARLAKTLKGMK